ncbi:unnamed protein product, partial [Oppiella nova]
MGKIQLRDFKIVFNSKNGKTIPSSFTGIQGSVKYWIEAEIDKSSSLFSPNHKTKAEFIVEAPIIVQNPMSPLKISGQKNNDIKMDAMITKRTFHPGELISCECVIVNKLSTSVRPRVTLKQTQTFSVRDNHNTKIQVTNKCVIIKGLLVGPGVTDMQTLLMPIPADIQLSIDCPIISVSYELHLTADIPLARDLHIDLPINITKFQLYEYRCLIQKTLPMVWEVILREVFDSENPTYGLGSNITGRCVIALDGTLHLSK